MEEQASPSSDLSLTPTEPAVPGPHDNVDPSLPLSGSYIPVRQPATEETGPEPDAPWERQSQPGEAAAAGGEGIVCAANVAASSQASSASAAATFPVASSISAASAAAAAAINGGTTPLPVRSVKPFSCESFTYDADSAAVADELRCPFTGHPLFDPVKCAAGHYNCRACLAKHGRCGKGNCSDKSARLQK